jgi:hypothetical protein
MTFIFGVGRGLFQVTVISEMSLGPKDINVLSIHFRIFV